MLSLQWPRFNHGSGTKIPQVTQCGQKGEESYLINEGMGPHQGGQKDGRVPSKGTSNSGLLTPDLSTWYLTLSGTRGVCVRFRSAERQLQSLDSSPLKPVLSAQNFPLWEMGNI